MTVTEAQKLAEFIRKEIDTYEVKPIFANRLATIVHLDNKNIKYQDFLHACGEKAWLTYTRHQEYSDYQEEWDRV